MNAHVISRSIFRIVAVTTLVLICSTVQVARAQTASCMVKISYDHEVFPLSPAIIDVMVNSPGVSGHVVDEYGFSADTLKTSCQILEDQKHISGKTLLMVVSLENTHDTERIEQQRLDKALGRLCELLRQELEKAHHQHREQLAQQLAAARERFEQARARMDELHAGRRQVREQLGDVPVEGVHERLNDVQVQLTDIEMELHVQQARREAIEQQMARIAEKVDASREGDDVLEELYHIREIRRDRMAGLRERGYEHHEDEAERHERERQMDERRRHDRDEEWERERDEQHDRHEERRERDEDEHEEYDDIVEDLEAGLFDVTIAIIERREELSELAGSALLAELNEQLVHMSIESAALQARREMLAEQRERLRHAAGVLEEYEHTAEREYVIAERLYDIAADELTGLEHALQTLRPVQVTVIGAAE